MMSNPLVSIIIPVYNVESYLDRCVQSVVNQSYKNLEIILVDDGSPDNCPSMCDEWAKKDNRVKVIHKQNGGPSFARNVGIDNISGEYAFFIDSDDEITIDAIEISLNALIDNNCDMTVGRYVEVINGVEKPTEFSNSVTVYDENACWKDHYEHERAGDYDYSISLIIPCCKMIKSSMFDNLRFEDGKLHEDEFFIHNLVSRCKKIAFIDQKLYLYHQIETSRNHTQNVQNSIDMLEALEKRYNYFKENNLSCADDAKYHFLCMLVNSINSHYEPNDTYGLYSKFKNSYKECIDNSFSSVKQRLVCSLIYNFPALYYHIRKLLK